MLVSRHFPYFPTFRGNPLGECKLGLQFLGSFGKVMISQFLYRNLLSPKGIPESTRSTGISQKVPNSGYPGSAQWHVSREPWLVRVHEREGPWVVQVYPGGCTLVGTPPSQYPLVHVP